MAKRIMATDESIFKDKSCETLNIPIYFIGVRIEEIDLGFKDDEFYKSS